MLLDNILRCVQQIKPMFLAVPCPLGSLGWFPKKAVTEHLKEIMMKLGISFNKKPKTWWCIINTELLFPIVLEAVKFKIKVVPDLDLLCSLLQAFFLGTQILFLETLPLCLLPRVCDGSLSSPSMCFSSSVLFTTVVALGVYCARSHALTPRLLEVLCAFTPKDALHHCWF